MIDMSNAGADGVSGWLAGIHGCGFFADAGIDFVRRGMELRLSVPPATTA